jgi:four helix bundle protein
LVARGMSFRGGERTFLMLDKPLLPHHRLLAFGVARELLIAVRGADIRDTHLRDQAMRAAQSTCLNVAEGAARVTRADKARAFTIARGECVEAAAAVEIAVLCGTAKQDDCDRVACIVDRLVGMLTRLVR